MIRGARYIIYVIYAGVNFRKRFRFIGGASVRAIGITRAYHGFDYRFHDGICIAERAD